MLGAFPTHLHPLCQSEVLISVLSLPDDQVGAYVPG